jgi:FKBP-type peptidyl-prolyl cis-trans isomerase
MQSVISFPHPTFWGKTKASAMRSTLFLSAIVGTTAFSSTHPAFARTNTDLAAEVSRDSFFKQVAGTAAAFAATSLPAFADEVVSLPSGVTYTILKSGDGPEPSVGELAGIKFKAYVKQSGQQIDDIFDMPEPYYTRVGSGGLIKVCPEGIFT